MLQSHSNSYLSEFKMFPYHPLKGIRVIEFCWIWAGPLLGQLLSDLGAEVIKVEWHKRFDPYRTRGVEQLRGEVAPHVWREISPSFHSLNRNKVGITVNLKTPEGVALVKRLAVECDLVIDNWTGGTLASLGLSVEVLKQANPKLVALSLSAFGNRSRLDGMRSYGLVTSALSGAESLLRDGEQLAGSPTFVVSDPNSALFGLLASVTALISARQADKGMSVSVSQLEAMSSLIGSSQRNAPTASGLLQGIFKTNDDQYVAITADSQSFATVALLERWCESVSAAKAIEAVRRDKGYAELVCSLQDTATSDVFSDLEVHLAADHPVTGSEDLVAAPWRVNGRRPPFRKSAPTLGEGNQYVFGQLLGMQTFEIDELKRNGII